MRVALTQGAYTARSLIADAQRCVNLYPEINPEDSPFPTTHYPTPGLDLLCAAVGYKSRCTYRAANGSLYEVVGPNVYYTDSTFTRSLLGTIPNGPSQVSMSDNGLTAVIVDGSASGWTIDLGSHAFAQISDPAFYGADFVNYLDTFFLFNRPGTNQLYISPPLWDGVEPLDPLDIAAKTGTPDPISAIAVMHREIWLLGTQKGAEVWYNAGGADFPFERMPGVFVDHGCAAPYSTATQDVNVCWITRDAQGQSIIVKGTNYQAERISTHAIETAMGSYPTVTDAVAFTYQEEGHTFYQVSFPTADKTWVYDFATGQWHERVWLDGDGIEHRSRANTAAFAYGKNVVGDWADGQLYHYDLNTGTDDGAPITRRRGFPHMVKDGKRLFFRQFIAAIQTGTAAGTMTDDEPPIMLRWSDNGGYSWGDAVPQGAGSAGQYVRQAQWQRLGMARDRVFEVWWSYSYPAALSGAYLDVAAAGT